MNCSFPSLIHHIAKLIKFDAKLIKVEDSYLQKQIQFTASWIIKKLEIKQSILETYYTNQYDFFYLNKIKNEKDKEQPSSI